MRWWISWKEADVIGCKQAGIKGALGQQQRLRSNQLAEHTNSKADC
jgi:hypothetical protein